MPTPILLITGYLGAGKTTLINRLLNEPRGRRLAAVVNDFGAINIDAALLSSVSDDVISLENGCVCCSLLGDLLQTLNAILRRDPAPDGIVIETSGLSNPAEIVRTLLDPVIWKEAALETVICVADARALIDQPGLADEALWRAQIAAADFVALSKTDLVSTVERDRVRALLRKLKADTMIHEMVDGRLAHELLFATDTLRQPRAGETIDDGTPHGFDTAVWTSDAPLAMAKFQAVISQFAGIFVRAKGFVTFAEQPDTPMLFQLVGSRATVGRAPAGAAKEAGAQLVFIARSGTLREDHLTASLARCRITVAE
jgi:G3E family GTPase